MHSLPSGEKPWPRLPGFVRWVFFISFLVVAGGLFILVSGGLLGLVFGVGPEDGGAMLYTLFGLIANLAVGVTLGFVGRCRGYSHTTCRLIIFAFTAPAFMVILNDIWKLSSR